MTKIFKSFIVGLLFVGFSSPAFAHSDIIQTTPEDGAVLYEMPETFLISYSENLIADGTFAVLIVDGQPITLTTDVIDNQVFIAIDTNLSPGDYRVEFKTVAADGHPQEGSINFTLSRQTAAVPAEVAPIEVPEVTIMQPVQETGSNLNALWGAIAVILVASALLARLHIKNKQ